MSEKLPFDKFYDVNKDKSLYQIFNYLNISPKDSDYLKKPQNWLTYEKIISSKKSSKDNSDDDSYYISYDNIYSGRYKSFKYIITERHVNYSRKIIIEIELLKPLKCMIEITDNHETYKYDDTDIISEVVSRPIGNGLWDSALFLILITFFFSLVFSELFVLFLSLHESFSS